MKTKSKNKRVIAKKIWIPLLVVLLAAAAGFGYYTWQQKTTAAADTASSSYKTSTVKKGSISISVSGSGTLIAGQSSDLSFPVSGTLAKVNVQVGDLVKKGD